MKIDQRDFFIDDSGYGAGDGRDWLYNRSLNYMVNSLL